MKAPAEDIHIEKDDFILLQKLRRGDEAAWRLLFTRFYSPLCLYAFGILHDKTLAKEVVNDSIFHMWKIRENLSIKKDLYSYLVVAVKNRCFNKIRDGAARKEIPFSRVVPSDDVFREKYEDETADTIGSISGEDLRRTVEGVATSLPEETLRVWIQSRDYGKSYSEISGQLGISVNTVKYHIKKALAAFRAALGEYFEK